jgi:hypothetical protein
MRIRTIPVVSLLALGLTACEQSSSSSSGDGALGAPSGGGGGDALRFFLPTGEPDNTSAPVVEVDAAGGVHALYPAYAGARAYYAYCARDCSDSAAFTVVPLETSTNTASAMLALDGEGRPHVLLADYERVEYASCRGDCTQAASWTVTPILDHHGDREVDGEAFALDPQGRPRFLMHTYVAYLGVGQKAPETDYVACDADCEDPASWTTTKIADQIWKFSQLRFDAAGHAHAATIATVHQDDGSDVDAAAYVECDGDCANPDAWNGIGLGPAYENETAAVAIKPAVALGLTRAGTPRVLVLGRQDDGTPSLTYLACDEGCTGDAWRGTRLVASADLDAGIDLALDAQDHPRFVYTMNYNIGLAHCEAADCATPEAPWKLEKVELGSEIPKDDIFLWPNCNVAAWFLHSPAIALAPDGGARIGYQARDISGGWTNPDPNEPDCVAGTDMTWSRLALVSAIH